MNQKAIDMFLANLGECQKMIDRIQEAVDDHLDVLPDDVNYANVGDAARLMMDLQNIVAYLNGEDQ